MRLNRLALALVAVSSSWAAMANPAINSNISGSIAGTVGASVVATTAVSPTATTWGASQNQARLDSNLGANLSANLNGSLSANLGPNMNGQGARSHSGSPIARSSLTSASLSGSAPNAVGMEDSIPRGWLMALVAVLLIGHQLRRKHRFLRPHRFSDL